MMISDAVRGMLGHAGITVNGSNPWDIRVNDERWGFHAGNGHP